MKVVSVLTLALGVAGAVAPPALAAGSSVHLVTSIEALSHAPDAVRYAVTVRPVGGPAHAVTLWVTTRRPAAWTASAPGCLSSKDRTSLACDLGEVRESERRTLHLVAKPGDHGPAVVPVMAQAAAANAPSVRSSLGVAHPMAMRLAPEPAGAAADEAPAASPVPPAAAAAGSPEPEPSDSPSPSESAVEPALALPSGSLSPPDSVSPSVSADGGRSPAVESPAVVRPPGRGAPAGPAARPRAPRRVPAASPAPAPKRLPAVPHAPVIPHLPQGAPNVPPPGGLPGLPTGGAPGGLAGGPLTPIPGASPSAALPQIAPNVAPSPGTGISELNTLSPAGAMQAGRTSWATVIAVAVVAEAGLLWLIAGLMLRRRRRTPRRRPRHRIRSPRLVSSKLIP